jgi:hypothetical protein
MQLSSLHIAQFFRKIRDRQIDIYNEISLQIELGIYLRELFQGSCSVLFERPISGFGISRSTCIKKEIDIIVIDRVTQAKTAIELKFPRNGQYPEQMFKFCQDICFLEQLTSNGFVRGLFLCVVDNPGFYRIRQSQGIYRYFTGNDPLTSAIAKPTGAKDQVIHIQGNCHVEWNAITDGIKYAMVEI